MLQHDRHFVRILLTHPRRKPHAPRMGAKTDVKVMLSRNPIARHTGKDFPHGPAQGVLHKKIVTDQVNGHSTRSQNAILDKNSNAKILNATPDWRKWRLLLPGASGPRLEVLPPRAGFRYHYRITRQQLQEHSCHQQ